MDVPVVSGPGLVRHSGPSLDVVVPLWNEAAIVAELHWRIALACQRTGLPWRVIYVDDGSADETAGMLRELAERNENVTVVRLSRNFGQPAAIQAGLAQTTAAAVVLMDGDLQDPPELIGDLVRTWRESDSEVVIARRRSAQESNLVRRILFRTFHRFFAGLSGIAIPADCGTFCLMGRRSVLAIRDLPESHRFFPGMRAWVGFRQTFVDYDRPERLAGAPRQSLGRLVRYAGDAVFGYSARPVVWMCQLAFVTGMFGGGCWMAATGMWIAGADVAGILAGAVGGAVAMVVAMQMLMAAYVAEIARRSYEQVKQRPAFVVEGLIGPDAEATHANVEPDGETSVRRAHAA